ncbi:hypothetical protein DQ04_02361060 [Trypanosoma grayi]|uniref:hypothetical protein n=1 Tax=Trypanosoma grayi TaxID=71804 RepID=UPI0004F4B515|nr:hypothetical protein DQ04_02361060 [Trypanosoma grayi]KEG11694.1 hypothetical protein DQ04_02361060 [Trypanosoma grayi]
MGGAQAKEALRYFADVVSSDAHPDEKEFTERLTRYKKDICSSSESYRMSLPVLRQLVLLCVQKQRVRWLLRYCLQELEHASCNCIQGPSEAFLAALHITEHAVRYAHRVARGGAAQLLQIMTGDEGSDSGARPEEWTTTEAHKLCVALMEYSVSVPLTPTTVEAHHEIVSLLLAMTSSALYHSTTYDESHVDVFTEMMMASEGLTAFLATLLRRLVEWGAGRLPSFPLLYRDGYQPSLRNLFNVFGRRNGNHSISCGESLGRHCAQLLAVLVAHQKGNGHNPALDYVGSIQDGEHIEFKLLLTALVSRLQVCPALCIVLYALVYDHPTFLHTAMTAYPKELLDVVQEVLHLSYTAATDAGIGIAEATKTSALGPATSESCKVSIAEEDLSPEAIASVMREMVLFSYPFISFMTSTLVLLFSQDQVLNKHMSDTVIEPRFKIAYYAGKLPISSLCIVVLAHGVARALNERNEPLAAVFIPSLSNLAPFIHDIDAYTSQRLLKLLLLTQRKLRRSVELASRSGRNAASGKHNNNNNEDNSNTEAAAADMFVRQLTALAEAVEGMLHGEDRRNDSLVYELLYNRAKLEEGIAAIDACSHIAAAHNALRPLFRIVDFYETELASVTVVESYNDILSVIRRVTREHAGSIGALQNTVSSAAAAAATPVPVKAVGGVGWRAREILFVYEESAQSYDFFGPFVWATLLGDAVHPGGMMWALDTASLAMFPE